MNLETFSSIKKKYFSGLISKQDFIDTAFAYHEALFDYQNIISDTDIKSIEIDDSGICFTLRSSDIKVFSPTSEKRVAPTEILNFNSYEKFLSEIMCLVSCQCANIFDVGANIGYYSLLFAQGNPKCNVYAFEPLPHCYQYLVKNISSNNLSKRITPFPFALSSAPGFIDLHLNESECTNASLKKLKDSSSSKTITCNVSTLDVFCRNFNTFPDMIKCDVEGAELLVFQGGENTILEAKPIIFSEILRKWSAAFNYHPNDIISFLSNMGYLCYAIGESSLRACNSVDENTVETNYLFLHQEANQGLIDTIASRYL